MSTDPFIACRTSYSQLGPAHGFLLAALVAGIFTPTDSLARDLFPESVKANVLSADGDTGQGAALQEAETQWLARRKPIVYIQELWKMFPGSEVPSHMATNFTMGQLYDYGHMKCVGTTGFVSSGLNVPSNFCRSPERVPRVVKESEDGNDERHATAFDEFLLERVMFARWRTSDLRCSWKLHSDDWCKEHADVVVVPSVELHSMVSEGFSMRAANRYAIRKLTRASFAPAIHSVFWEKMREKFYKPDENYTPLLVISASVANLLAPAIGLAGMPTAFQGRIMFVSSETNTRAASFLPAPWQLAHQTIATKKADSPYFVSMPNPTSIPDVANFREYSEGYDAFKPRPIAISLQTSIAQHPRPSKPSGKNELKNKLLRDLEENGGKDGLLCHKSASEAGHTAGDICGLNDTRTMWEQTASSSFCLELPTQHQETKSHLYVAILSGCIPVIFDESEGMGSTHWAWRAPESEDVRTLPIEAGDSVRVVAEREQLIQSFSTSRVYYHDKMDAMLAGDYVVGEVLNGDLVGLPSVDGTQLGTWYFPMDAVTLTKKASALNSKNRTTPFLDYRDFAVIFDAREVREGNVDVIGELLHIMETPGRFDALRRSGIRVAPLFRYVKENDGEVLDAFTNFEALVTSAAGFPVSGFPLPG